MKTATKRTLFKIMSLVLVLTFAMLTFVSCKAGSAGADGKDGVAGKSAYDLAVENGFDGTVQEWLESLKGSAGTNGEDGADGKDGIDGKDGVDGKDGTDGKDGKDGEDGTDGKDGVDGKDGADGKDGTDGEDGINGKDGADGKDGTNGKDGVNGKDGEAAENGKSAYELAVENGFVGTEDEWLASLQGKDGANGADGTNGAAGKSAYELAVDEGFEGTLAEWLDSLKEGSDEEAEKAAKIEELLTLKHELRVDENGDFRVVVISDIQCSTINPENAALKETINNIKTVIDNTDPDLVLLAGDNLFNLSSAEAVKTYLELTMGYVEEKQIPWAHVYGNHDDERNIGANSLPKEEQQKVYESFEYCISKAGDEDLFGVGNYVLPVLTNDGTKIAFNIWGLDSGHYVSVADRLGHITVEGNTFMGHYQSMERNQVDWYVETSKLLEEYNGGVIPAMMYFHIPLQEMYAAWNYGTNQTGVQGENISAHVENVGLFSAILDRGDVSLIVNGHDHLNDFSAEYRGVTFAYTACIGTEVYHDDYLLGGRVINYSTENPTEFETYMSYVNENPSADSSASILELVIGQNGSVTNGSTSGPEVKYNEYDGTAATVKKDTEINRNVISFAGGANTPSTYTIKTSKVLDRNLADGFSFEVLFKVTEADFTKANYLGILDYEEKGGFGLNIRENSTENTAALYMELAVSDGSGGYTWKDIQTVINLNEWCHCVGSYDGEKLSLYVNGQLIKTIEITSEMALPNFEGEDPYICIGGCAQAVHNDRTSTGIRGYVGDMAICNILSESTDANGAAAMYDAAMMGTNYILNLKIADDGTVSSAAGTSTLKDYTGTPGTKTVKTDNTIARKFISFDGETAQNASSTYYVTTSSEMEAEFADGFAIETMFRATQAESKYTGIIDYAENGGFDVNFQTINGVHTLIVELGHGSSGYAAIKTPVELNKWYHCVVDFNASDLKLTIYLNGMQVGQTNVTTGYRRPIYFDPANSNYPGPYISVGSLASNNCYNERGFTGDIAIANIHADSLTATDVATLYNAVKPA